MKCDFDMVVRRWLVSLGCKHVMKMFYNQCDFRIRELKVMPVSESRKGMILAYEDIMRICKVEYFLFEGEELTQSMDDN